jgi:predicted DsbA family dithiol-disulfide isomerase
LKTEFEIDIRWTAFPLHPETPKEGMTLEELFAGRPINIKQVLDHLSSVAAGLGLPLGKREKTYNSRLAQELGKLAEQQGLGEQFHMAAFKAYFADGWNIGLDSSLVDLGTSVGLSEVDVKDMLENRTFKKAVDEDWNRSHQKGVTAVPTFVLNDMSLVGAQPYEKLVELIQEGGIKRRI